MAKKEVFSGDLHQEQPSDILTKMGEPVEHPGSTIQKLNGIPVTKDYLDELAFLEEPVTVEFLLADEKFGAPYVDATNNGKGIEAWKIGDLDFGRWCEVKQVPRGIPVVIKRKYLGIFATAKVMRVRAGYDQNNGDPVNRINRSLSTRYPFTTIGDSEKGQAWLQHVMAAQ